jgi:VWFA-related protein
MKKYAFRLVGLLALIGSQALAATAPPAGQKRSAPSGRYRLDLVAVSDGKPVMDLTAADLELLEDGKKVPIRSLAFVPASPGKRLAVIFHDMNLWIKNVQRDKDDISEEILGLARTGVELMIIRLDSPGGLKVLQPFTRDESLLRRAMAAALEKVGMNESYEDLGGRLGESLGSDTIVRDEKQNLLLSYYYTKRQRFERTIGGLMTACCVLRSFPGRKSVLLVSGGIPDISSSSRTDITRNSADAKADGRATMDAIHDRARQTMTQSRLFDPFGLLKEERFEQGDEVLARLIQFSNAMNVSIYALDPGVFTKNVFVLSSEFARPEATESESIQSETRAKEVQALREVADSTSGRLFRGANKFDELKTSLGADLEGYYELAFKPETQRPDLAYHKIEVRTARRDVDLRSRTGYREYSAEETKNLLLISAYYNPTLFTGLPFDGTFVPFFDPSGKWESWIGLALPVGPLFIETPRSSAVSTFSLYLSFREREQDSRGFTAKIEIPVRMTDNLRNSLPNLSHLWSYFKGPDLAAQKSGYDVVYILQDMQTGEIGGWSGTLAAPDLRGDEKGTVLNRVLGSIAANPQAKGDEPVLDAKNGVLNFKDIRFYPRITDAFSPGQDAWVFLQAHLPLRKDKDMLAPQFMAFRGGVLPRVVSAKIIAESWNVKTKIWSGVCRLGLAPLDPGEYDLEITIPGWVEGTDLMTEVRLTKMGPTL